MIEAALEDCLRLSESVKGTSYHIIWSVYVVVSILALLIIFPILRTVFKFIHSPITMCLTRLLLLFSTVFLVMFIATSFFHLYNYLTADQPCQYIFYVKDCLWSFPLVTLCLIGIATSQAGLSVARLLSTINVNRKLDESHKIGCILAFSVLLISLISLILGFLEVNFQEPRVICALIPTSTALTANILFYFLLFLDFLTLFLYFISWYRTKKLTEATWYSLALRFKIMENFRGIKICLPLVVMHFLMFGFYTISTIILRNNRYSLQSPTYDAVGLGLFIIPLYILLQNILLYIILQNEIKNRQRFQRSITQSQVVQTEAYFNGLYNQWNSTAGPNM